MQERRLVERKHDIDIHRAIGAQACGADLLHQPHAAVDFHGARVDALHFRQECRLCYLLDQDAAHAALAEIDRERQPGGPGADDQNIAIHRALFQ